MKLPKKLARIFFLALVIIAITIIPASTVLAASVYVSMSPSSATGPVGTVINLTGTGATEDSTYNVYFNSVYKTAGIVHSSLVNASFAAPEVPRGSYLITVASLDDSFTVFPPYFTITPQIYIDETTGHSGDEIIIGGNGFSASSTLTVLFDDNAQTTTTTSNSKGTFVDLSFTIPETYGGDHTIKVRDSTGASPAITFTISPQITVSDTEGVVGSTISISGEGFSADSTLSFYVDNEKITGKGTTNSAGAFEDVDITIPAVSFGTHTLKIQDASSRSVTTEIDVYPIMSISPTSGTIGTTIDISCSGLIAKSDILVTYDGAIINNLSSLKSDAKGNFYASFEVPAGSSGDHTIRVMDTTNTLSAKFSTSATASINMESEMVGTDVTITGGGFEADGTVTIMYDNQQIGTKETGAKGEFEFTFAVPESGTGLHKIVVTDQVNTEEFDFSVEPSEVDFSPESGYIGTSISISSSGFVANGTLTVKYDSTQIKSVAIDDNGNFSVSFEAPVSTGGNHTITISDGTNEEVFNFAMDSEPPSVPKPVLPEDLTKAEKIPTLSWNNVVDPSGVTYNLQVSKDATFNELLLQKTGLTNPTYTFTEDEELESVSKKEPYYWRVQAVDGADNASEWSTESAFTVGFTWPSWATYLILGIVAVLFGVGGFFAGMYFRRGF